MIPKQYKLLLIGFGNVSQGLITILRDKASELTKHHGTEFKIVGVCTGSRGNLYNPEGLDLDALLILGNHREGFTVDRTEQSTLTLIHDSVADIVIELSPTDLNDGEPAISHCRAALESGKHIVCANKGPATLAYTELSDMAHKHDRAFLNEATVLSGTPVFSFAKTALAGINIQKVKGILNGSTNFILGEMEDGLSYEQALDQARQRGYLEADPEGDVGGYDAQAKLAILCNILFDTPIRLTDVNRVGIADITETDVAAARAAGERWKLIATLRKEGDQILAEVGPERLSEANPLAQMNGTLNALTFTTDLLGDVTVSGPGAGGVETGFAILTDLLIIHKGYNNEYQS